MRKGLVPALIVVCAILLFLTVFFIYPVAGEEPHAYRTLSSTSLNMIFNEQDLLDVCPAPFDMAVNFPPSPVQPPLPPKNTHPYEKGTYSCFEFANDFCQSIRDIDPIEQCFVMLFDNHAANLINYVDENGNSWVCVVEPQTNEYYCMPIAQWKALNQTDWIKTTLCTRYYGFSAEKCNKPAFIIPLCPDIRWNPCSESQEGDQTACYPEDSRQPVMLQCKCRYIPYEVCSWTPIPTPVAPGKGIR